jgi:hypothetical protein
MKPLVLLALLLTGCGQTWDGEFGWDPCKATATTTVGLPPGFHIDYTPWPCSDRVLLYWGRPWIDYDSQKMYDTREQAIRAAWEIYRNKP